MKKYDTVIFDMDGTLIDTLEDLTDSVNHALAIYDFPLRTTAEIRTFIGNGVGHLMELSIPGGLNNPDYEMCLAAFRSHYAGNMQNKTIAYDGITELLKQLSQAGYKLAIVSNKYDKAVKELSHFYFPGLINLTMGETEGMPRKPSPDIICKVLAQLASVADKVVYVGDTDVDAATAKNSGIIFVGVTWGYGDKEVLKNNGADYIIEDPQELRNILNS